MFIIPLEKNLDWKRPPVVTVVLILINCVVFFFGQAGDDGAMERAVEFYSDSVLPEIEFPEYLNELAARGEFAKAAQWRRALEGDRGEEAQIFLLMEMETDDGFMQRLRAHDVITETDARFEQWEIARTEYQSLLHEAVSYGYGFVPSEHGPLTLLTHMFLHAGVAHLVGNMVFLLLVGFALEVALGSLPYLLLYLVGGLGAVGLFWAVYPSSDVPLVGASGAIAGLMGLYALVFGLRRIRFFYSILFYFDYVRAPAILMLPLWLANEFYQLQWGGISNVAYVAHIGGLLAGGLLGAAIRQLPGRVDTEYLDASAREEERNRRFEQGLRLLGSLQVAKAKTVFRALHGDHPEDREILLQLYKAEKVSPDTDAYHQVTRQILALSCDEPGTIREIHETFRDYVSTTRGKVRIDPAGLVGLATRFARAGHLETAEQILVNVLRSKRNPAGLEQSLLALAQAWQRVRNEPKYRHYLSMLVRHFPQSNAAVGARQMLATPDA